MDWWTQNKDAVIAIVAVLGVSVTIIGALWAIIKWGILRGWQKRIRVDVKVFELITDPAILLRKLYATESDNNLLADHNIKYQPRDPNRDLQSELKAALNRSRYLLITAPTGYGKTREAGVLAQTMMLEGWRVLRIKNTGWLDIPKTLPAELENNRSRVLIFLDDLNGLFTVGERTESPRAEKIAVLREPSYHDRLLLVLDMFEGMCTKSEIRVIATARSETDQWKVLNYNENDKLWKRFERIEIPEPIDISIINLLDDATKQANLKANADEFKAIAHKSDGTYRNIILNLRRSYAQNKPLTKDNFKDTLNGSWQDIYAQSTREHPAIRYIYDAIDILRQIQLSLHPLHVKQVALLLWGGSSFKKLIRIAQIKFALEYLTTETRIMRQVDGILSPSDGQIEAKQTETDWHDHTSLIKCLIVEQRTDYLSQLLANLVFYFGMDCLESGKKEDAIKIWHIIPSDKLSALFDKITSISPNDRIPGFKNTMHHAFEQKPGPYSLHFFMGIMLESLERYSEAEDVYRQCIARNPDDAYFYTKLGDVLRYSKRYTESEDAYHQAIEKDPNYADAYSRLGSLFRKLRRFAEAEENYHQAITKDPNNFDAAFIYFRLGEVLRELERWGEAEVAFRQAILKDPKYADAYLGLGNLLRTNGRIKEALSLLKKAIDLDSEKRNNHIYLFIASISKQLGEEISPEHIENARQSIAEDSWYNLACLESICDNFDVAFEHLRKAVESEEFNPRWAWEDPDLEWIRSDPRFVEIVGSKPAN